MKENNPLSPHIQIYNWHVSSLVSISHRITGIVNYFLLIFICIWASSLFFGEGAYEIFKLFLSLTYLISLTSPKRYIAISISCDNVKIAPPPSSFLDA